MRDEHTKISIPIAARLLTQYPKTIESLLWRLYENEDLGFDDFHTPYCFHSGESFIPEIELKFKDDE